MQNGRMYSEAPSVCGTQSAVDVDQRLDRLDEVLRRDGGHAEAVGRIVEAVGVAFRAEQLDIALRRAVRLHALKNFLRIVEHRRGGVHLPRAVGHDAGVMPAFAGGIVHQKHMIAEDLAEAELGFILRLLFGHSGARDLDIQHFPSLLFLHTGRLPAKGRPPKFCRPPPIAHMTG